MKSVTIRVIRRLIRVIRGKKSHLEMRVIPATISKVPIIL